MKADMLLIHFGELSTKGDNRKAFISCLLHNIRVAIKPFGLTAKADRDHIYVSLDEQDPEPIIARLQDVSGIQRISLVIRTEPTLQAMKEAAFAVLLEEKDAKSFKMEVKRVDKRFPLDSYGIACEVAGYILEHGDYSVGNIWDWTPTKVDGKDAIEVWGNVYGGDQVYDNMRKMFVEGNNSLSVAGEAGFGKYQCDERGCYMRREVKQLMEISLCKVPANKHCTISWYNKDAKLTKSFFEDSYNFDIEEYEIHKSYNECPYLALKKSLCAIGYDAHATDVGVAIDMSWDEFEKTLPYMKSNGLSAVWYDGVAMVNEREHLMEIAFKKGYEGGYIEGDGTLNRNITKSKFKDLMDKDLLREDAGSFYIGD